MKPQGKYWTDHDRGSFFEEHCAKRWRKENKKTGISADDWWEQNKHRDFDMEFRDKLWLPMAIFWVIIAILTVYNFYNK